jgi:lipid-A-disaccharide synthase
VLVATGEASGDRLAADLLLALARLEPDLDVHAVSGPALRAQGVTELAPAEQATAFGLVEVVRHLPRLRALQRRLVRHIDTWRPDVVLTVDSPSLLLPVARHAKRRGIRAVHAVCPQVWASRPGRVRAFKDIADAWLCLLPFEPALLQEHGANGVFIGHPRVQAPRPRPASGPPRIVLAPGSRTSEVRQHWPVLCATAARVRQVRPDATFVVPVAPTVRAADLPGLDATFVAGIDDLHAHAALACSGTLTLELATAGIPQVVLYRVHPLTWAVGRHLLTTPWISLPNVLAGEGVVPEHVQRLDPDRLADDVLGLIGAEGDGQIARLAGALAPLRDAGGLARGARAMVEGPTGPR